MPDKIEVIEMINAAFADNTYPGDDYLLGSTEGSEPMDEVQPFIGLEEWSQVSPDILDKHSGSLNFFSEAGFRFFLPAFMVADLNEQLVYADPLFSLVHGFSNISISHEIRGKAFIRKTGQDAFINPKRYAALTFEDYSRFRLSVFTREEAAAIVSYLQYKKDIAGPGVEHDQIAAALDAFWLDRAHTAPEAIAIQEHLQEEENYLSALLSDGDVD
jgi:hypothetical protein